MSPLPQSLWLFPSLPFFSPSHLHSTHAPLLCLLSLHLCSDYSFIDSHADVAIGGYADPAIDTHNRAKQVPSGYSELWSVSVLAREKNIHFLAEKKVNMLKIAMWQTNQYGKLRFEFGSPTISTESLWIWWYPYSATFFVSFTSTWPQLSTCVSIGW